MPKNEIDWEDVCGQFYHACGGMNGLGDVDWVDDLVNHWSSHFEEPELELSGYETDTLLKEKSMEDDGFWYEEEE